MYLSLIFSFDCERKQVKTGRRWLFTHLRSLPGLCTPLAVRSGCCSSSVKENHPVYPGTCPLTRIFTVKAMDIVNLSCQHISQVLFLGFCPSKPYISEFNLLDKQKRQFSTAVTLSIAKVIIIPESQLSRSSWNSKTVLVQDWGQPHRPDRAPLLWANTREICRGIRGKGRGNVFCYSI